MSKTLLEQYVSSESRMRRFQQERAISAVTGLICELMEQKQINRAMLAEKLGKSKGWVTQLLEGDANKTIRTVADVLAVLGEELRVTSRPISIGPEKPRMLKLASGTWAARRWDHPIPVEPPKVSVAG
jgi:hypothetical protein